MRGSQSIKEKRVNALIGTVGITWGGFLAYAILLAAGILCAAYGLRMIFGNKSSSKGETILGFFLGGVILGFTGLVAVSAGHGYVPEKVRPLGATLPEGREYRLKSEIPVKPGVEIVVIMGMGGHGYYALPVKDGSVPPPVFVNIGGKILAVTK